MVEDANLETAPRIGAEMIRFEAARAPAGAGVYRMLNDAGEVLYVGKAKSIKKRVLQYAQGRAHSNRIALMVSLARAMEFVSTATETEALLLEANLIKTLKPRFNILLRDDKSFAELLIRKDHEAPQILKHRGARRMKGAYFGPFASTWAVNHALATLQRAFLLRTCSDSTYESRTRPCLLYQIKRCSAPCTGVIGLEEYGALAAQAESFLKGRSRAVIEELSGLMQAASDDLDFEKAAVYRDRIRALSSVSSSQTINPKTVDEADVFALHLEGGQACVQVFFFRAGQNWGTRAYFPRVDVSDPPGEILSAFLAQFYQDRPPPRLILTSSPPSELELLTEALSLKAERKVEIATPQRGEKLELVEHAGTNAREALGRRLSESSAQSKLLAMTAEIFGLETPPQRIEVYDNSHIQGTNAVGAFIVAGPEGFEKSQYRKFNFKPGEVPPGDDYAMMRKVLMRRFSRMLTDEADGGTPPRPDLLLIDGGAGQLEMALEALRELGLEGEIAVVGVAKGPDRDAGLERFFMPGKAPFMLPPKSAALYYLQRLRDEAHRFAIGAHRTRRAIDMTKSPLDEIDGVGPRRKKALLHAFGSARDVAGASLADLAKVEGVNDALAQRIFDFFNPQP